MYSGFLSFLYYFNLFFKFMALPGRITDRYTTIEIFTYLGSFISFMIFASIFLVALYKFWKTKKYEWLIIWLLALFCVAVIIFVNIAIEKSLNIV